MQLFCRGVAPLRPPHNLGSLSIVWRCGRFTVTIELVANNRFAAPGVAVLRPYEEESGHKNDSVVTQHAAAIEEPPHKTVSPVPACRQAGGSQARRTTLEHRRPCCVITTAGNARYLAVPNPNVQDSFLCTRIITRRNHVRFESPFGNILPLPTTVFRFFMALANATRCDGFERPDNCRKRARSVRNRAKLRGWNVKCLRPADPSSGRICNNDAGIWFGHHDVDDQLNISEMTSGICRQHLIN